MEVLDELITTARSAGGYVMAVAVVSAFFTMAAMLWSWRKIAPPDR